MRKLLAITFAVLLAAPVMGYASGATATAPAFAAQEQRRVMRLPQTGRRRRVRADRRRGRNPSIGSAFARAGRSAGRGGAEFGRGMGGFGEHTGRGFARIGKSIARAFTQ